MNTTKFTGTAIAIITPFKDDKTIDFPALEKLIEHYIEKNINYLVVLGTTGENATLTEKEKNEILDFCIEKINGRIPIVAGFGGNNTNQIIKNIQNRNFSGIDAILSVAPYYNKPSQNGLIDHFTAIAQAAPVPIFIYNVPGRTAVNITAETTLKLAENKNIIATKEASGNMTQIMKILKNKPKDFLVISGDDPLTLPMITLGASGVISVVAMAEPEKMTQMVKLALNEKYKEALTIHNQLLDLTNAIFEDGNPSGIKAALYLQKRIKYNLRQPLCKVNKTTFEKIRKLLK